MMRGHPIGDLSKLEMVLHIFVETDRDHEEVFIILDGSPSLVVDGREIETPAGTFARLDPHLSRTVVNHGEEPASVLIVSAPRSSGYEPMEWA